VCAFVCERPAVLFREDGRSFGGGGTCLVDTRFPLGSGGRILALSLQFLSSRWRRLIDGQTGLGCV
jgi:hypothetical protein